VKRAEKWNENVSPGLIILDIMVMGKDGFAVCRGIRPFYKGPI
jgi:two-component system OmpR family response regulator/two-component system response regulator RstA